MYPLSRMVKGIVEEKESRVSETAYLSGVFVGHEPSLRSGGSRGIESRRKSKVVSRGESGWIGGVFEISRVRSGRAGGFSNLTGQVGSPSTGDPTHEKVI